jgi:hypothetical protein
MAASGTEQTVYLRPGGPDLALIEPDTVGGDSILEPMDDGSEVSAVLTEWAVEVDPGSVPAGEVTFNVENAGAIPHELVVIRSDSTTGIRGDAREPPKVERLPRCTHLARGHSRGTQHSSPMRGSVTAGHPDAALPTMNEVTRSCATPSCRE